MDSCQIYLFVSDDLITSITRYVKRSLGCRRIWVIDTSIVICVTSGVIQSQHRTLYLVDFFFTRYAILCKQEKQSQDSKKDCTRT